MRRTGMLVERMRSTPKLGGDVVTFVVMAAISIAMTLVILSHLQVASPLKDQFRFSADFEKAPAIQMTAVQEVRIAGIPVGKIIGAEPKDGRGRVDFQIDSKYPVYKNASVHLTAKSPVNVMYVTLNPGSPSAGRLAEGDVLPVSQTSEMVQPYELLDELDARARVALTDIVTEANVALANASQTLPKGLNAVDQAAASFQPVVDALAERRANLKHLVGSLSAIAVAVGNDDQRLARLIASLETALGVVSDRQDDLGASIDQLPGVTNILNRSMVSTAQLSNELSPTLKSLNKASGKLEGAVEHLSSTVVSAREAVVKARPVVAKAEPVVADLRPLAGDLKLALGDLEPVTSTLPEATKKLVPWLNDLGAFIYNSSSSFSLGDVNGGLGRANLVLKVGDPLGGGL